MAGTKKRSRKDIDPWQGIRQLREKAKELQHTEYEPYTAVGNHRNASDTLRVNDSLNSYDVLARSKILNLLV
jgi:hypothetical protein